MPVEEIEEKKGSAPEARGFIDELRAFGATLPYKWCFVVLLIAWVALFHFFGNGTLHHAATSSLFGWLGRIYEISQDDRDIGMMVPVLILGLLWWKREELAAVPKKLWWPAVIGVAFALLLHVIGYVAQATRLSLVGLFLGLYAMTGALWGWSWLKATFFPAFLMVFLMPLPQDLEGMTLPLRLVSTNIAVAVGQIIGIDDVAAQGAQIIHPVRGFGYNVEAACSGLRSLTVMSVLSCVFAFITFRTNWKRALMVVSAVPLAILSNSLRLLSIIIGGNWKYDQLKSNGLPVRDVTTAAQTFGSYIHDHHIIKLVPYAVGFVCLMLLARWLREEAASPAGVTS
jgi:exosortase